MLYYVGDFEDLLNGGKNIFCTESEARQFAINQVILVKKSLHIYIIEGSRFRRFSTYVSRSAWEEHLDSFWYEIDWNKINSNRHQRAVEAVEAAKSAYEQALNELALADEIKANTILMGGFSEDIIRARCHS